MNKDLRKFCVAPMMGYTTPHARRLYRILSKRVFLFTEMVPSKTLINSTKKNLIIENNDQNPIALQVGGSDYKDLIECAKIAQSYNYDEINLNVGCPSKAVQKGNFGACLMKDKYLVRECLQSMIDNCDKEVTLKCRIGINNQTSYNFFKEFISVVIQSGIKIIYVHARDAILSGLNPKNNRTIPPLKYDFVEKIKNDFPEVQFIINGGIKSLNQAYEFCKKYDGVMVGRLIQSNPFCLLDVDRIFFNEIINNKKYKSVVFEYFNYIKQKIGKDSIFRLLSPLLYIFFSVPNGKKFKNEIHQKIKNNEIDKLENIFLDFIKQI
jgi:tRNA-dihydrouridine synthase A